jgi:hypothetical protein
MVSFDRFTLAFIFDLTLQGSVLPGPERHGGSGKCKAPNRKGTRRQTAESAVAHEQFVRQGNG